MNYCHASIKKPQINYIKRIAATVLQRAPLLFSFLGELKRICLPLRSAMALIQQSTSVKIKVLDRYASVALDQVLLNIKADTTATFPPNHAAASVSLVQ